MAARIYDINKIILKEIPCYPSLQAGNMAHITLLSFGIHNMLLKYPIWKVRPVLVIHALFWVDFVERNKIEPVPKDDSHKKISYLSCKKCPYFIQFGKLFYCWDKIGGCIYPSQYMYFCPKEYWRNNIPERKKVCDNVINISQGKRARGIV